MLPCGLKASGRPLLVHPDEALLQDAAPSQSHKPWPNRGPLLLHSSNSGYAETSYVWSASGKVFMTEAWDALEEVS